MEQMPAFGKPPVPPHVIGEAYELEDFQDNPSLYRLLSRLPAELHRQHISRIGHLSDEEAEGYLYALHERRDAALRESEVSDERLKPYFEAHKEEIWTALETHVFTSDENHVGAGTTARIKRFDLSSVGEGEEAPAPALAIKYLVSPNERTLTASGEHDMISEVEQIEAVEQAELRANGADARIRVPHPYFHYRKGKVQCYGMELIDGVNLEQGRLGRFDPSFGEAARASFAGIDRDALMREIDAFFDTMHGICLHGDIKPRNLMVSRDGKIYVIDFGQSVLATSVDEKSREAFEELKEAEKQNTKDAVRFFLDALFAA